VEQQRGSFTVGDQNVHAPIVIVITHGQTAPNDRATRTGVEQARRDVLEPLTTLILEEQGRLPVERGFIYFIDVILDMAVSKDQIQETVVVEVEEFRAERDPRTRGM